VHSYDEMLMLAVHQVVVSQVSHNTRGVVHAFYECPSLPGVDKDAQKQYFCAKALEKCDSKCHQWVSQIHADGECSNGEECDGDAPAVRSMDTTNWTNEDWLDYQSGAWILDFW
jgi:hypothetical protein